MSIDDTKNKVERQLQLRRNAHVKTFFSSGMAQTNGGGSFCIATYSLVSYKSNDCELDVAGYGEQRGGMDNEHVSGRLC